jgi:hypothetical protein
MAHPWAKKWTILGLMYHPGIEASISILQCKVPSFDAKSVSPSLNLPSDQQIAEVKNPRRLETHFRSPQLDLWQVSDTEWLLALRRPEPVAWKKPSKITAIAEQLTLPSFGATG